MTLSTGVLDIIVTPGLFYHYKGLSTLLEHIVIYELINKVTPYKIKGFI